MPTYRNLEVALSQRDVLERSNDETAKPAVTVFELSQPLKEKSLATDDTPKRRVLEIVCLNCTLDGATLCPEMRKPFDVLAEGLISKNSRDDCRSFEPWTTVRDTYATSFFSPRPWYLSELAAIADDVA